MQESRLTKNLGNILKIHYIGCILLPAQQRGLQFYQTKSSAVVLYDTLPAEFIEQAICMKTEEQLYQRESERPFVALKANSQCESQDPLSQELRSSWETQSDAQSVGKPDATLWITESPGMSFSTFQEQDEQRQFTVAKLIEKFESHKYKEQFLQDIAKRRRSTCSVKHRKNC